MKNKNISTLIMLVAKVFQKYNLTIFIVVLTTGLAVAVLMLNTTLQRSTDTTGYTSTVNSSSFDQATINQVKQLHTSSEALAPVTLPSGRINPFAE